MVGGVVELVLLFQKLWRRSQESGETLSHTEVVYLKKNNNKNYMVVCVFVRAHTHIEKKCFQF